MKGFEERLERLEKLAAMMRDKDVPLEDAMALFDEGAELSQSLEDDLKGFERKVEILANLPPIGENDEAESPQIESF